MEDVADMFNGFHLDSTIPVNVKAAYCLMSSLSPMFSELM